MTDHLESELRRSLTVAAAELPTEAIRARLRTLDYHPRPPRLRPVLTLGGAAGVAVAAGTAISLIGLGAGTQPAFAGWSATPTEAPSDQLAAAEAACTARSPTSAGIERARAGATRSPGSAGPRAALAPLPKFEAGDWKVVLTDTRGPYTTVILEAAEGKANETCLTGPSPSSATTGVLAVGAGFGNQKPAPVPAGEIRISSVGGKNVYTPAGGKPYTQVSGHVGVGVTGVTLVLDDGTHVTTTVENGLFLAWWPGDQRVVSAEVTTTTGTTTQSLYDPEGH